MCRRAGQLESIRKGALCLHLHPGRLRYAGKDLGTCFNIKAKDEAQTQRQPYSEAALNLYLYESFLW